MKREKIKVPRGTARRLRRMDMAIFRAEREKRREAADASTISYNLAPTRGRAPERNPHHHSVATVTDMGGYWIVRQYAWTLDYPANIPAPHREEIAARKHFKSYGAAKEYADEINRIAVPEPKPLRVAA